MKNIELKRDISYKLMVYGQYSRSLPKNMIEYHYYAHKIKDQYNWNLHGKHFVLNTRSILDDYV